MGGHAVHHGLERPNASRLLRAATTDRRAVVHTTGMVGTKTRASLAPDTGADTTTSQTRINFTLSRHRRNRGTVAAAQDTRTRPMGVSHLAVVTVAAAEALAGPGVEVEDEVEELMMVSVILSVNHSKLGTP